MKIEQVNGDILLARISLSEFQVNCLKPVTLPGSILTAEDYSALNVYYILSYIIDFRNIYAVHLLNPD